MTEPQIPKLVAKLVENQTEFSPLSVEDAQWAILNPKEVIALVVAAIQNRVRPVAQAVLNLILAIGEITFPGATNFVARAKFVQDVSETAAVKISGLGSNFSTWFLGKVEADVAPSKLGYGRLLQRAKAAVIIAFLGGDVPAETSLAELHYTLSLQPNGPTDAAGALLTNGWANIFFVKDVNGVLRLVIVYWYDGGWYLHAIEASDQRAWHGGDQVFSRKKAA